MYYAAKFGQYMYRGRPHDVRFNDRWHTFTPTAAKGKRSRYRWTGSEVSDFFFLFSIFLAAYFSKFLPFRRSNSPSCVVVTLTWYRYLLPICTFRNAISEKLEVTAVRASYKCLAALKSCTVMSCSDILNVGILGTRCVQSHIRLCLLLHLAQIFFLLLAAAVRVLQ